MDDDPPTLTIAASNDESSIVERRELESTNWIIRRYTANFLRVMRGAGRPHELLSDLNELVKEIRSLEHASVWSFNEHFAEVIRSAIKQDLDERGIAGARRTITRGVLQMLASEMASHSTQKRRGESEIAEGVRDMDEAWAESRRQFQREWAETHPVKITRKARARAVRKAVAKPTKPEAKKSTAEFMKTRREEIERGS